MQEETDNKISLQSIRVRFGSKPSTSHAIYKNKIIATISENEIHKLTVFSGHRIFALE